MSEVIRSTCPYCGVGCGVLLKRDGEIGLKVEGDPDHPANYGRLCSKGLALGETTSLNDRVLTPQIGGKDADWDTALDLVASKFKSAIAEHGPDSVAFYVSGQLLTEDYYIANKLMKGFIGSANIDTNSRLCMASTVAGHKRAFGSDTVPGTYEDLELADLVVLVGSNLAWCHPVLYQRLVAARQERGTKVVVVDPRRTSTCEIADLHLKIDIGSDVALFNGLLAHLKQQGQIDQGFVGAHTDGFEAAVSSAQEDLGQTGLSDHDIQAFFALFGQTEKTVTVFSQGVNQSSSGTDKVNAIINCHLATGRIGKPGMGPFSVTGQPNAMGGRETGGLANMLAAHMDLENPAHNAAVKDFWSAEAIPATPGLKAIDMFKAVAAGQIKALWIACTNPVVSFPQAGDVAEAIKACDFVVVSDLSATTDTAKLADVVLPATGWGEKDGTVTNSDRTISRQKGVLVPPGQAKHDWEIYAEVGRRMGWTRAFDYQKPVEIFREHAALSGIAGGFGRDFDISGLSDIEDAEYESLVPTRWPISAVRQGGRFFGDGQFFTPTGRAKFLAVSSKAPATKRLPKYPYRLNTGRIRDQWHTMTRTAKTARLSRHFAEPFLQIHPKDASDLGLKPADLAQITSPHGHAILRVLVSEHATLGAPFAPMHWTGEYAPAATIGNVISAATDPFSGQPESKASVIAISKFAASWYGFAVSLKPFELKTEYWAQARADKGWRAEFSGTDDVSDWASFANTLMPSLSQCAEMIGPRAARFALWEDGVLTAALFLSRGPVLVARDFVAAQLGQAAPDVMVGQPGANRPNPGPVVCSCMNVGRNTILSAISNAPGASLDEICATTSAGITCGSCRSELVELMKMPRLQQAAE
ncbi:MAG: molybdopterin-dependent oxidoreductase [Pseudomonadota bacterium]